MANSKLIKPQTLKGFRDYLPGPMIARERLIEVARNLFRSYGFAPIDTPALEYSEILLGKGGEESDKQLFRFTDAGNRDVAMRFDLTVPFARFTAQHLQDVGMPFKRYHIGTVWRAEKPQKGRYREFMQCDFDTIGTDSNAADIETLLVIHDLMKALGFEKFTIRINNRKLLNGLLESLGVSELAVGILRSLDKLVKIGHDAVVSEIVEHVGLTSTQANAVLDAIVVPKQEAAVMLDQFARQAGQTEQGAVGEQNLRELFAACAQAGIPSERLELDVSIARGLDYYTGTIYETFLGDLPTIGSVCSGGRYDDLAGLFTNQTLPGVGASLGLDRLLAAMEELGMLDASATTAAVLVTQFDGDKLGDYLRIGRVLREAGIATEVYPEAKAIGKQFKYADRKGFRLALVAGSDEFAQESWQVKDLASGDQETVPEEELISFVRKSLGGT